MPGTLRRFLRNRTALFGLIIVAALLLTAVFAPVLAPQDPVKMELRNKLKPPSSEHWLGTDEFGRDIASRIVWGSRISIQVGVISVGIALVAGGIIGLISGLYGGWVDMLIQRVIDVMLAFPGLLLALAIIAVLGPGLQNVMIAVGIGSIPGYVRLVRGSVLAIKEQEFVEAARALGATDLRLIFRHLLPNIISPIIVLTSLGVAGAILSGAALSFIGMGAQPPSAEWGAMLSSGRDYLRDEWWVAVSPGVVISVVVLAFNLVGDGLRDALDPHLRDMLG